MKTKRLMYLTHRWLGVLLCLFMAMWFFSGVVMMYVGYPKLTQAERLGALPRLDGTRCCLPLADALKAAGIDGAGKPPRAMRLTSVAGNPRYVFTVEANRRIAVDALNGRKIDAVNADEALDSARAFMPGVNARYAATLSEDAWTHSAALKPYRPLHRVDMDDDAGTALYIASNTGEVVRDATRLERNWNWVGAWIHWLYPFRGGSLDAQWHDIVVNSSIVGTVLAAIGLLLGIWRWRFSGQYKTGSRSPYREPWMRWHHIAGLLFGIVTVTFIFSGLMSMNPFKVLDSGAPKLEERIGAAGRLSSAAFAVDTKAALNAFRNASFQPVELEWRMVDGKGYLLGLDANARTRMLDAALASAPPQPFERFDFAKLETIGRKLLPTSKVTEITELRQYDFYYYGREPHTMTGGNSKPMPVLRMKFDDSFDTWIHLDPYTGAVLNQLDSHRRTGRWLFAFLHSFDWLPLLNSRPSWDIWMIGISLGGFVVSITGVVVGWRRLRKKAVQ